MSAIGYPYLLTISQAPNGQYFLVIFDRDAPGNPDKAEIKTVSLSELDEFLETWEVK